MLSFIGVLRLVSMVKAEFKSHVTAMQDIMHVQTALLLNKMMNVNR